MNEKDFNLAILAELKRIANEVFSKVKVSKEGTYTAAELWNEKDAFGESIVIEYKGTESEIYTAEIGTFKMQVTPKKLWYVLWKFEKLCNVRQADKMRFTYGKQEGENISEKAMYLDRSGKEVTRKKSLVKLSERVAIEPDKKTKSYNMYYLASGVWFLLCQRYDESQYKAIKERIEKDENYLFSLLQRWDFNTENRLNTIYKALFEALKSERVNNTPEERKCENEAGNSVICDNVGTYTTEKSESVQETNEDYPPEPYNKEKSKNVASLATIKTRNVATSYERFQDRTICGRFQKNMRPNYLRQNVFPTESFQSRRKIRRFKRLSCLRYTNYHPIGESAANQTEMGEYGIYSVVTIRGSTG